MDRLVVRKAGLKDLARVLELCASLNRLMEGIASGEYLVTGFERKLRNYFSKALRSRNSAIFVAESRGRIVGFIFGVVKRHPPVYARTKHVYVDTFFVEPGLRGKGVGRRLMAALATWAMGKGAFELSLTCHKGNSGALAAYSRMGFEPTRVIMKRRL